MNHQYNQTDRKQSLTLPTERRNSNFSLRSPNFDRKSPNFDRKSPNFDANVRKQSLYSSTRSLPSLDSHDADHKPVRRLKNQIFWTETFPYVYHSVGKATCPRYDKLFLDSEEPSVSCSALSRWTADCQQ